MLTIKKKWEDYMNQKGFYPPLTEIRLAAGNAFYDRMARDLAYLKKLDCDRMLYNFRKAFGEDTRGAEPIHGWDEPDGLLRGHSTGHFISALAIAYSSTGDGELLEKSRYMVSELRKLQLKSKGRARDFVTVCTPDDCPQDKWSTDPSCWGEGFLSAYSPDQFALLEQFTPYARIWAPYYTLHKLAAGFIETYERTGNEEALETAKGIGGWMYDRLSVLSPEHLSKMWKMYIAGEYGGMNESMARLYRLTGDERYLKTAKLFDNPNIFPGLSEGIDTFRNLHANQHIPQIMGAMLEYEVSDDESYHRIAKSFFHHVTHHHMYAIGGVGQGECFRNPDALAENVKEGTNCETCATYNLLKLSRELYAFDPENTAYMDYYERGMINHILASQNPDGNEHETNAVTYMLPIGPGAEKDYSNDYWAFTCCHGTGMENHVKYPDAQYFITDDTLYINQYIPTSLRHDGLTVHCNVAFPDGKGEIRIQSAKNLTLKLRIPLWCGKNPFACDGMKTAGRYAVLDCEAGREYVIAADFPCEPRFETTPDCIGSGEKLTALLYGPCVMVTFDDAKEYLRVPVTEIEKCPDEFALIVGGRKFVPGYTAHGKPYHTYFIAEK